MATRYQNTDLASLLIGMLQSPVVSAGTTITGLSLDSRTVDKGFAFVALAKDNKLRHQHIEQALSAGCQIVLFDESLALSEQEHSLMESRQAQAIAVRNLADKTGEIAARFYGHPSLALTVIAVTGTNGKTSVSQFIAQCLENLDQACGVIGTLGVGRVGDLLNTGMTTPDPVSLQKMLAEFCQQSIPFVVLEASSHALEQGRLNSVAIDVAVLTNLSRDHLDYHADLVSYAAAKKRLFDFQSIKSAIINSDDSFGKTLIEALAVRKGVKTLTYGHDKSSLVSAQDVKARLSGLTFSLNTHSKVVSIKSKLLGQFNVDNLLATAACLLVLDIDLNDVVKSLSQCEAVEGRMQSYSAKDKALFVIDYAHTPDALLQALVSLQNHVPAGGKLWCVFGCGGDRDAGKRSLMGETAEANADKIILTADNPRSEDNKSIVADILKGMHQKNDIYIEHDRQLAIDYAASHASSNDIVLVAGKGHELYQEIAGVKTSFSDKQAVLKALKAANDEPVMTTGVRQ